MSYYHQGLDTFKVPMKMHGDNRKKLIQMFQQQAKKQGGTEVALLQGGKSELRDDTDHEHLFHQESYFQYLFGVKEPNFFGAIDVTNGKSILFIDRVPPEYAWWMGEICPPSIFKELYEVDEAYYVDEIEQYLKKVDAKVVHVMYGMNTDSDNYSKAATFPGIEKWNVDNATLFPLLRECRVIKSEDELNLLRYVNKISSRAHIEVMKKVKPGMMEYQIEALFQFESYHNGGCRHNSYTCICASGHNGATLHYGHAGAPNNRKINDGEMVLLDMGAEYHCYGSDITRSYPVNGKFTPEQIEIYETVQAAQEAVMKAMKPGVLWPDMHRLANRVILEELTKKGFLQGDVKEMETHHIGAVFMPHGLGHFLGLDTHDVGGYPEGSERIKEPALRSLRTVRKLEEGMVLTVEPGVYFVDALIEPALKNAVQSKYLVKEKIDKFRKFGGVRLEDDVIVTKDGIENMTLIPRSVKEIEAIMASK